MPNISKKNYEKYKAWLHEEEVKKNWKSQDSILNLEDDIDFPIRNTVAILALAGCYPIYSCCGFDYRGQPSHKSHQYGEPYVMCLENPRSVEILGGLTSNIPMTWWVNRRSGRVFLARRIALQNPHWSNPSSTHFYEELAGELQALERGLFLTLSPYFLPEVILEDTNKLASRDNKYWQYMPKNPWVITPESLYI